MIVNESEDHQANAKVFKAFCDENRLRILELLRSGEKCACVILERMDISQPTLSHHMRILCDSGIVISRRDGKWMYYSISGSGREYAAELLRRLTEKKETDRNEKCCE